MLSGVPCVPKQALALATADVSIPAQINRLWAFFTSLEFYAGISDSPDYLFRPATKLTSTVMGAGAAAGVRFRRRSRTVNASDTHASQAPWMNPLRKSSSHVLTEHRVPVFLEDLRDHTRYNALIT